MHRFNTDFIPLSSLSSSRDSDQGSETQFSIDALCPAPEEDSRLRTRLLDYCRQYYCILIKTLGLFSILTISIIIVLVVFMAILINNQKGTILPEVIQPQKQLAKYKITTNMAHINGELSITGTGELTTMMAHNRGELDNIQTTLSPAVSTTTKTTSILCHFITCSNTSCTPTSTTYTGLQPYFCCSCLPEGLTFKRYQFNSNRNTASIVLNDATYYPGKLSALDLQLMKPLQHLHGSWIIQIENDDEQYLVYDEVHLPSQH